MRSAKLWSFSNFKEQIFIGYYIIGSVVNNNWYNVEIVETLVLVLMGMVEEVNYCVVLCYLAVL